MPGINSRTVSGHVSRVRDGDTIVVSGTPVRLASLDCAEKGTAKGDRTTRAMRKLVSGERLQCKLTGRRSYDRMIGECKLSDGTSISRAMIRGGYCGHWW